MLCQIFASVAPGEPDEFYDAAAAALSRRYYSIAQARDDASVDGYAASYDNKNHGDQRA